MRVKTLIIIVLLSAFSMTRAQMNDALLEKINFNEHEFFKFHVG